MTGRLDRRLLGTALVALGLASAIAVAVDAGSPPAVLLTAALGVAAGLGLARLRPRRAARPCADGSRGFTLAVLALLSAGWIGGGTIAAAELDAAGLALRSELFALCDGLVVAVGVRLRSRGYARRRRGGRAVECAGLENR